MDTNYIIETKNLTKQYGSQKSVADLNIHVKRGRIYGLLGRNGLRYILKNLLSTSLRSGIGIRI